MMKRIVLLACLALYLHCYSARTFAADGWASVADTSGTPYNLTGGSTGSTVTVATASDLNYYATRTEPYVIQVSGTIDLSSLSNHTVNVKSNKTITGIGTSPTIYGHLNISNASNIIIERLNINYNADEGSEDPWTDGITIQSNSHHVWINHCSIYNCPDGLLDIGGASDYITVSWCKFYYEDGIYNTNHRFPNLIGSDDGDIGDRGKLHITFHHNWWAERCRSRMPRVRFGQVHIYNNYYGCNGNDYCIHPGIESQLLIENNYFYQVDEPIDDPNATALVKAVGNMMIGCTNIRQITNSEEVFTPPYSYYLNSAPLVKNIVMAGAGAAGIEPDITPPAIPTGLKAEPNATKVILEWNENTEPDLAGYNIYRSVTSGTGYSKLNSTLLTSPYFADIYIIYGKKFYYVVKAVDTSNNESYASQEVTAIPRIYGDFNNSHAVNLLDLDYLYGYWLLNDCGQTEDIDIDDNCIINFVEFSAMAENWLKQ